MAKISIERAPPTGVPLRFFLTAPAWGALAGVLLLCDGDSILLSRWAPSTLALVHALTLGVLGNAMMGSLLQFLPAAAGVEARGGAQAAHLLHALLNIGTAVLVAGFWRSEPVLLRAAAILLPGAFMLLAVIALPGLVRAAAQRLLTLGIAMAIVSGVVAAGFGARLALGLAGDASWGLPLQPWADVHASWGVIGWITVLLASVGQVVMPMFQGTSATSPRLVAGWLAFLAAGLLLGSMLAPQHPETLRWFAPVAIVGYAGEALWRQLRRPRRGEPTLVHGWRAGLVLLAAAALLAAAGAPAVLTGALVLGVALPLLVVGMQLEIVAFICWIGLRRSVPRGTRIPGVQHLLPSQRKSGALAALIVAGVLLVIAAAWPQPALVRTAGVATTAAYVALFVVLAGVGARCRDLTSTTREPA